MDCAAGSESLAAWEPDIGSRCSRWVTFARTNPQGKTPMIHRHISARPTRQRTKRPNAAGSIWRVLVGLVFVMLSDRASAQQVDVPATWGGDIFSRPRLTGDWDGLRDELGQKGITFDTDLLMTPQVVTSPDFS
jgi:hypothetical protein